MQKVVVIGANGFLGSNLSMRLAEQGKDVLALVFKGTDYHFLQGKPNISIREFTFDDILDLSVSGYDTIFHMAWAGVSTTYKNEAYVQAQNILYGIKVLEFAQTNQIGRVVIPGSAAEVSCGQGVITGYEVPAPSDMYSSCKVATRYVCQTYAKQHSIELIWTLITSIYGPGRNDNNLITYAIKTLLKGEKPSFTGLEQKWDYLYIDDLIDALLAIGEKGKAGKVYPIGSGEHKQLREYVEFIRNTINPALELGIGDIPYKNPDKIDNQILDISELVKDTGFKPAVTFEIGILNVIKFFQEN